MILILWRNVFRNKEELKHLDYLNYSQESNYKNMAESRLLPQGNFLIQDYFLKKLKLHLQKQLAIELELFEK